MYEKRKSGVQASLDFLFYARRTSNSHHERYSYSLLGPGTLTAHRRFHLVLLHSCPDTVHRFLLRKTQTSTPLFRGSPTVKTPSVGQHPCYSGLQVQGTANSPAVRKLYDLVLYDGMTCRPSACLVYMAATVLSSRSLTNKHCIKIHFIVFLSFFIPESCNRRKKSL